MNPEDITAELRDIKPPVEIPEVAQGLSHSTIAAIIIATVVVLGLVAWWLYRRRRRTVAAADPVTEAIRELEIAQQILTEADSEAYAIAVSNVLRRYIERHLGAGAVRQTTDEFLAALAEDEHSPLREHRSALRGFLAQCDLVKFARGELGQDERQQLHATACDFVRSTATPNKPAGAGSPDKPTVATPVAA